MARMIGTLKGAMTPTTPTGTRREKDSRSCPERSNSPYGAPARAAASWHSSAPPLLTCRAANGRIAPDSRTSQVSISCWCSSKRRAARRRTAARSEYGRAAHSRWARTACSTALSTSAGVAEPTRPNVFPVAGSTASYPSPVPLIHSPEPEKMRPSQVLLSKNVMVSRSGSAS